MSRISKQIAEDVSKAMTTAKREVLEGLKTKFKAHVREIACSRIGKKVMDLFEKDGDVSPYMSEYGTVQLFNWGFSGKRVYIGGIPYNGSSNSIELTREEGGMLWDLETKIEEAEKEVNQLQKEIYVALYETLKTYKNVEKHFPEAFPFLPSQQTSALCINLDLLRQKIK